MSARRQSLRNHRRGSPSERKSNDGSNKGLPRKLFRRFRLRLHLRALTSSEHQRSPPQRRPLNRGDRYSARSNIAAARSSVSSSNAFDWSCSPIGSFLPPSSAKPALIEMPGIPAMFVFTV